MNLLDFYNDVFNIYVTKAVDIIYLDFQKAFNKVPRKRLIKKKSESHGIAGKILIRLEDWPPLICRTEKSKYSYDWVVL